MITTTFKLVPHKELNDVNVVEVWDDNRMVGCLYPIEHGIRLVTGYGLMPDMYDFTVERLGPTGKPCLAPH